MRRTLVRSRSDSGWDMTRGYLDAGGPGRLTDRGDLTMLVAQLGNIARVGCERWLTSSTEQERARNADWVAEFLDEPVTVRTVDRILLTVNG